MARPPVPIGGLFPKIDGYTLRESSPEIRPVGLPKFGQAAKVLVYRDNSDGSLYACKLLPIPTSVKKARSVQREVCSWGPA